MCILMSFADPIWDAARRVSCPSIMLRNWRRLMVASRDGGIDRRRRSDGGSVRTAAAFARRQRSHGGSVRTAAAFARRPREAGGSWRRVFLAFLRFYEATVVYHKLCALCLE